MPEGPRTGSGEELRPDLFVDFGALYKLLYFEQLYSPRAVAYNI